MQHIIGTFVVMYVSLPVARHRVNSLGILIAMQKITDLWLRLRAKPELLHYLIVGVSVYLLELVVIVVAQLLGAKPVVAVGISFWTGLVVSFLLQKFVTFGDKRVHHKVLLPQILAFSLLVLWNFLFTIGVTALLAGIIAPTITRTLALAVTTIWNFYLYKTRIFRTNENPVY